MAKRNINSVDEYILAQPEAARPVLQLVRAAIQKALPAADEAISYGLAVYKVHGKPVIYFAGWKRHYSLYPASDGVLKAFADELSRYEVDKRTVRFGLDAAVPVKLIGRIAKFRAAEVPANLY